jgi:signal transduction histidine kinase
MSKELSWVAKRHWWFIGLLAFLLLSLEYYEVIREQPDSIHFVEYIIYLVLLLIIGALFDSLLRVIHVRIKFMRIIEYKHKLSLEFSVYNDWDVLVTQMARFPSTIAAVEKTSLFVFDSISSQFELAAQWPAAGEPIADLRSVEYCQKRLQDDTNARLTFRQFDMEETTTVLPSQTTIYCLPIQYGKSLLAIMQFKLKAGEILTNDQDYKFKNISDKFAYALTTGQERKKYYEMTTSETALAERRKVSLYLHDHLGHNLSYLHFKLDQLVNMKNRFLREQLSKILNICIKPHKNLMKSCAELLRPSGQKQCRC